MYLIDYNFVINEPSCVCSGRTFSNTRKSVLNCKKIKRINAIKTGNDDVFIFVKDSLEKDLSRLI